MKQLLGAVVLAVLTAALSGSLLAQGTKKKPAPAGNRPAGAAPASAAPNVRGDLAAGKKLYKAQCAICHFADASILKVGPGMKGLFKQEKLANGQPATEENVRKAIWEGSNDPRGPLMPAYKDILTPREMNDLMAYLKTL